MWISCRVRSDSHTLTDAPFRLLQLPDSTIRVQCVRERDFVISVRALDEAQVEAAKVHYAHHTINAALIALNAGTIGSFYWYNDPWVHPVLTIADDVEGRNAKGSALIVESNTTYEELKALEEQDIYNSMLIFGIVAREDSNVLTGEYCRGLLLLRMNFYELNFRREAFLCFYRALEHFVAARILRVKKLRNELRDLQRGLAMMGASQEAQDELRELYAIRSSQVAHSQIGQRDITSDEVIKIKAFLDFIMHKTFKKEANQIMRERRDAELALCGDHREGTVLGVPAASSPGSPSS